MKQFLIIVLAAGLFPHCVGAETLVTRDLSDPDVNNWAIGGWISAGGKVGESTDVPSGKKGKSLEITINYTGKGFQYSGVLLSKGEIPGKLKKVTCWAKSLTDGYAWGIAFDSPNKAHKDQKLDWGLKVKANQWVKLEFMIPADWPQPLTLARISAHNHSRRNVKTPVDAKLLIYGLEVVTDISGVKDRTSLLNAGMGTVVQRNTFIAPAPVVYKLNADSWLGETIKAKFSYTISDIEGKILQQKSQDVSVDGAYGKQVTFKPTKYGIYTVSMKFEPMGFDTVAAKSRFAYLPKTQSLTKEEKKFSPWGLNIHGGMTGVAYDALAKSGFVWIRDYAYSKSWMLKGRGDGTYPGWPWHKTMEKKARDAGLITLPIYMASIRSYIEEGKLKPDRRWKIDLLQSMMDFPDFLAWEIDNEYDLKFRKDEIKRNWVSYDAFHKMFGRTVHFLNPDAWAVENGTAGIQPERTAQSVKRGAFDDIDVVNGHFYCGTMVPELASKNANTGGEELPERLIFDALRDLVKAACSDGKKRQTWITEFGWDTLVGHIVTEHQQAAHMQRAYMLMNQAGIDKMFWYWNLDTKNKPRVFFDGCGIYDRYEEPKPVVAAFSAMAHLLKKPEPVGTFDVGANGRGYLVRDAGRLVACLFKLDPAGEDVTAELKNGVLLDMYGNPLEGRSHKLDVAPIWIVDVPESDPIFLETAFDLQSHYLAKVTAGDTHTVELRVRNNRKQPIAASYQMTLPKGWTADRPSGELNVPAGKTTVFPIRVTLAPQEKAMRETIGLKVTDGGITKTLDTVVMIIPAGSIAIQQIQGTPGKTELKVVLTNNSSKVCDFKLQPVLPKSWSIVPATTVVKDIPAGGTKDVTFQLTWDTAWKVDEKAELVVQTPDGKEISKAPIIPNAIAIPQAKEIKLDGDLSDFPKSARLPKWMTGLAGDDPNGAIYVAWSPKGLYFGVEAGESKAQCEDPTWFWVQDCLEVCLDTMNNRAAGRKYGPTDFHLWFCPQTKKGGVYAGRWKQHNEIKDTQYGIAGIAGASKKTAKGYSMEWFIPAEKLQGYQGKAGAVLGMSLILTVQNPNKKSEVFWPASKSSNIIGAPAKWGFVTLK